MQGGVPEPSLRSASLGPVCGRPVVDWRIFGGSGAPDQQWPWQASLQFHGKHICGAALIDNFWVISAAHCFQQSYDARDYLVLLGYHELHGAAPHGLQAAVHRLIIHKAFNKDHFLSNDLALLQLRRPVDFTPHILPICLPEPDTMLPIYATCWVTGWGKLTENDFLPRPSQLQEGRVSLLDRRVCKVFFQASDPQGPQYTIDEGVLCAGTMRDNKSICRGDSGGPLSCQLNDTWFLAGLSSWSLPCRSPVSPSVFTRLAHFSDWVLERQKENPPPPRSPQHKPASSHGPSSMGAVPGSGVHRARLLSQALPLLLPPLLLPPPLRVP
ncbi:hypothetical protein HJG60_008523 [Phyllostomus discolor]|uniref:tryptase n=1 Tax=Phyllostomus discolor TaxID=89673 RepID=A0A833YSR5_9CHIR|nr:hypothetical protein HJG60_008523 [Phyllostomus discolor]